ncbi:hypothetical protein PZA11_007332 [Diplocarpon coronariae]|nr:hypothetical protein JHW43_007032 [Diplocarpon mali]
MAHDRLSPPPAALGLDISSTSTMVPASENSSRSGPAENLKRGVEKEDISEPMADGKANPQESTKLKKQLQENTDAAYPSPTPYYKPPLKQKVKRYFKPGEKLRPFRLLRQDLRNIRKRYISDWTLFNQLVFASAVYVFFTNMLPGITFASDLYVRTGMNWGTIEVEFLPLMTWSLIHAGWMHYLLAIFNAHDWTMQYVTTFSADIFSLLNSVIYFHKAVQELQRNHAQVSFASFLYSVIGAIGTFLLAVALSTANSWKPLFHRYIRMGLAEYAAAISIIIFIGLPRIGELATLDKQTLVVQASFRPSDPTRNVFFVHFWELPVQWIFLSIIPGAIITVLFYFDHEISSIICTLPRYGTTKPGGFAWDIMLLGTTTALCGILGIPPANGLLPQAPLHSESLLHVARDEVIATSPETGEREVTFVEKQQVYEQRWSPFLQAAGILVFASPPFQRVLGLTPTSVLAGLFLFMGEQSLAVNPILFRFFYMLTPPSELPALPEGVQNYWGIHGYTAVQIVTTGVIFYVTLTVAAPAFPVIIIAYVEAAGADLFEVVPIRLSAMNRIWGRETLRFVDAWACREGCPEDEEDRRAADEGNFEGGMADSVV